MYRSCVLYAAMVLLLVPRPAQAQDVRGPAFSLQNFRPAIDSEGFVTVDAPAVLGHLDLSFGLVTSYAHDVLHLARDGRTFDVQHLLTPQLQAAFGLFGRFEVGFSLPVHILFGARTPGYVEPADRRYDDDLHFSAQFVGDVGLHLKARLLDGARAPVGLGALLSVYAPTGKASQLLGEGQVTIRPALLAERRFGPARRLRVGLEVGALIRPATHRFTDGGTSVTDPLADGGRPLCAPAPAGAILAPGSCGTGASRALGSQLTYGVAVAVALVPQRLDLIGEAFGAVDLGGNSAASPLEGLVAAKVYLAARSYFEIGAGAGLLPATITREGGMTGSPQLRVFAGFLFEPRVSDRDGDGIPDGADACPDDPEDFDGFEDEDGCPDPDNDRDGLLDRDDACPNVAGPIENHGCPWPDSDRDGLPDKDDECPHQPGPRENQGCPPQATTRVRGGHIVILQPIFFETAKAIIKPVSYPTLDDVAQTMQVNPQLVRVEIQGHADERGDDDFNLRLTEARAAAVRDYLIARGVAPARLEAHGYGETRPLCHEHEEACWSRNRRVEFVILERSDLPPP